MNITNVETKVGSNRSFNQYMTDEIGPNLAQGFNDFLEGILNFVGLGSWFKDRVVKPTTKFNDLEQSARTIINKAISEATAQGEAVLSKLQDKLLYMPKGSPTMKSFINDARKSIEAQIKKQNLINAKRSAKAADAEYYLNKASNASAGDIARGEAEQDIIKAKQIAKDLTTEERI